MTSLATAISSEKAALDTLSATTRAYFRARLKNRLHQLVLIKFREKAASEDLTKAKLARRMGRKPEVVNRLLGAPGNWELDTLSDLLLAISGEELDATASDPERKPRRNSRSRDLHGDTRADPAPPPSASTAKAPRIEAVPA